MAVAALAAWILYFAMGYLVHGLLLRDLYLQHGPVMRPEADASAILPAAFAVSLIGFFVFAYSYAKGYEGGSGLQEGLRFGVLVGLMLYMLWPAQGGLLVAWLIDFIVEFALYGMVVGVIYRPRPSVVRRPAL
jgi:hypothetical protein